MSLATPLNTLSHHAYLLVGGDAIHAELLDILERVHHIPLQGNADLWDRV